MITAETLRAIAIAAVGGCLVSTASADPTFRAEQVIEHFDTQEKSGLTRSLCIGTAAKCRDDPEATVSTNEAGFDLTVTFEFGSARLTSEARENLEQFSIALKDERLSNRRFVLEGHTDAVGTDRNNQRLSEQRARSVADYLTAAGIDGVRLTTVGYGEDRLAIPEDPDNADNRRVEARMILD